MSDEPEVLSQNNQLILVSGESGTGKSVSLRGIPLDEQPEWFYLNCEAGKKLPFRNKFTSHTITDPYQVHEAFDYGTGNPNVKGMIVDTATYLLDMFETLFIINSSNSQRGWQDFQQFWKLLMQQKVPLFEKPVIILAHTKTEYDEVNMVNRSVVPVKGALKNQGLESYFSTVVSTRKMEIKNLKDYANPLLNITDDEKDLGFKHVFQTRPTKQTIGDRVRTPIDMFDRAGTFMDNDVYKLLQHMNEFYNGN